MWFRRLSEYLLAHPLIALPISFLLAGSAVLDVPKIMPLILLLMLGGTLSLAYAGLVTLLQGALLGACFMTAVTLPYFIKLGWILYTIKTASLDWMIIIGISFSCLFNILVFIFSSLIRKGYTLSSIMQSVTLLGVFVLCLVSLCYPGLTDWWASVLQKPAELAQAQAATVSGQQALSLDAQKQFIESVSRIATGVMIAGLIFCSLILTMLSRAWQGFLKAPGLLKIELSTIRLSRLTGILFALGVLISCLGSFYPELNNDLITAIMPIGYMLFLMVGLILVHYFFGFVSSKTRLFWLLFFYIFFIYMAPFSMVLVAMIALFDIWIDLRKRFPSV